jgi:hypothetical protein
MIFLLSACGPQNSKTPTLDEFESVEKGMTHEQIINVLGEPDNRIIGSPAFVTYVYYIMEVPVYLGFISQANYLDSAYYFSEDNNPQSLVNIIPSSVSLPEGIKRKLTLSDFDDLEAGTMFFPDAYSKVGPPDNLGAMSGLFSSVYYLDDGGRISLQTYGNVGCIRKIVYSPKSYGDDLSTLSEDTEGKCNEK